MADRTSARLFGKIYEMLAENPSDEHKAMAKAIWPLQWEYDFSEYQMDADNALVTLGLAKLGIDPKYPDEGEKMLYADVDGQFE